MRIFQWWCWRRAMTPILQSVTLYEKKRVEHQRGKSPVTGIVISIVTQNDHLGP